MPINSTFLEKLETLRSPHMGTELVANLIYSLIRYCRPNLSLEIGLGYTTVYILQALADNVADAQKEKRGLMKKTYDTLKKLDSEIKMDSPQESLKEIDFQWTLNEPSLLNPGFYFNDHTPRMIGIDDFSFSEHDVKFDKYNSKNPAKRLEHVVSSLGLSSFLDFLEGDFRMYLPDFRKSNMLFDFIWFDCGGYPEYFDFVKGAFDLINPDGGILLLHFTVDPQIARIKQNIRSIIESSPENACEVVNLIEPHKLWQNSVTLVRRISGYDERKYQPSVEEIRLSALRLLQRCQKN